MRLSTTFSRYVLEKLDSIRQKNGWRFQDIANDDTLDLRHNDYLGLATHPLLIKTMSAALQKYGLSARGSRLNGGTTQAHLEAEHALAQFKGTEDAVLFSSGYQLNSSVLRMLHTSQTLILADRLCHHSMLNGFVTDAGKYPYFRYKHQDFTHLEKLLRQYRKKFTYCLIVTEGLFSMDGDSPDVDYLAELAQKWDADVYLDEAHSVGIKGPQGRGLGYGKPFIHMGTLSKALGLHGAYIAGGQPFCDLIRQTVGGFIFSTALPPSIAATVPKSLELCLSMDKERGHLLEHERHLREHLKNLSAPLLPSSGPILPILIGTETDTLAAGESLKKKGILVGVIRPPTVAPGTSRLRLSLSCHLSRKGMEHLKSALTSLFTRR